MVSPFPFTWSWFSLKPHLAFSLLLPFLFGLCCHHRLDSFKGRLEAAAPSPAFCAALCTRPGDEAAGCRLQAWHFISSASHDYILESIHLYLFFSLTWWWLPLLIIIYSCCFILLSSSCLFFCHFFSPFLFSWMVAFPILIILCLSLQFYCLIFSSQLSTKLIKNEKSCVLIIYYILRFNMVLLDSLNEWVLFLSLFDKWKNNLSQIKRSAEIQALQAWGPMLLLMTPSLPTFSLSALPVSVPCCELSFFPYLGKKGRE